MTQRISVITSSGEADTTLIEEQLQGLDYELDKYECSSDGETIEAMTGADIVINAGGVEIPREVIEEVEGVQAILVGSHGFNHIDHEAATDQSIMVVNAAGFCTEEVSNHAVVMILACAKKLTQLNELTKAGKWGAETRNAIMPMVPIYDQTLGLVAFGNIARAVARKMQAFGMDVIAYDPYLPPWIAREYQSPAGGQPGRVGGGVGLRVRTHAAQPADREADRRELLQCNEADGILREHLPRPRRGRGGADKGARRRRVRRSGP